MCKVGICIKILEEGKIQGGAEEYFGCFQGTHKASFLHCSFSLYTYK